MQLLAMHTRAGQAYSHHSSFLEQFSRSFAKRVLGRLDRDEVGRHPSVCAFVARRLPDLRPSAAHQFAKKTPVQILPTAQQAPCRWITTPSVRPYSPLSFNVCGSHR